MEGKIQGMKVDDVNVYPITVAEAVYIQPNLTLAQYITNQNKIINNLIEENRILMSKLQTK